MKQQSDEWFKARKNRITGSVAGAALGFSPWLKKSDLMKQMVLERFGHEQEFKTNPALEYGKQNEATAIECFKLETGLDVEECGFFPHENWLGASPDGLTSDGGVLEVKCPFGLRNDTSPQFKTAEEQPQYYAQMQIEMTCSGRDKCHFYQWNAYAQRHEVVNLDPIWLEENTPKLYEFWLDVQHEPEWKYIHGGTQAREYELALKAFEEAKDRLQEAKDAIIDLAGPEGGHVGDFKISKVTRKGSVDYKKIVEQELPDFDTSAFKKKDSEYWKVS